MGVFNLWILLAQESNIHILFVQKGKKIIEIKVHERMKPDKCSICDYSFTIAGHLNNHIDFN